MNAWDIAQTLLVLGAGGTIGAIASFSMAASRTEASLERFASTLATFAKESHDPKAAELVLAYEEVKGEAKVAWEALARLKRALRWKP